MIRSSNEIQWLLISVSNWIYLPSAQCCKKKLDQKILQKLFQSNVNHVRAWVRNHGAISDCFLQVMIVPRHCWGRHLRLPIKRGSEILRFIAHILRFMIRNIEIYFKKYWDLLHIYWAHPTPLFFQMGSEILRFMVSAIFPLFHYHLFNGCNQMGSEILRFMASTLQ